MRGCGMRRIADDIPPKLRHGCHMTTKTLPSFAEWESTVGQGMTGDPLWSVQAYRISMYLIECHSFDRESNARFSNAAAIDQLTRSLGSIAANLAEGYSRASSADRLRFYGYALGSARESITWYNTLRSELGPATESRQEKLVQVRRLLLTTLRRARTKDPTAMLRDFDTKD